MQEFLNLRRLLAILSRNWFENKRSYFLYFLLVAIFLAGWFTFFLVVIRAPIYTSPSGQLFAYFIGLFTAGCLSASFLLQEFSSKSRTLNFLAIPASALEKMICILFYGVLVFFITYSSIFMLTDWVAVKFARMIFTPQWQGVHGITIPYYQFEVVNPMSVNADIGLFYPADNYDLFALFFPVQSAFILGVLYFPRNSIVKTVIALLTILLLFLTLEIRIFYPSLPPYTSGTESVTTYVIPDAEGNDKIVALPQWARSLVFFAGRFLVTPLIWLASYYRLKEKQI